MTEDALTEREELTGLIESARLGDREAMGLLLHSSRAALRERAERELPVDLQARVDPSDVIQEVLLEASHDFPTFRGRSTCEWNSWLQRVLSNTVIECLRRHLYAAKRSVRQERALGAATTRQNPRGLVADESSPSQRACRAEMIDWLEAFQTQLDHNHQRILRLRYWEERSLNQIADEMQLSKSGAARLLRKALQALRQQVTKHFDAAADAALKPHDIL